MVDEYSVVAVALERINEKLDRHDEKFDMIAQTLQTLVKIDTETKEMRESQARLFKRVEVLEHNQTTDGCPAHKNFLAVRTEQLKSYDSLAKKCEERHKELDNRLKVIEELPKKRLEVAIVEVIKWATIIILGIVGVKIGLTK